MAFLQPIEIGNTGLVARYWRLTHSHIDHAAGAVEFHLHGYADAAARAAGKPPLPSMVYRLDAPALGLADLHAVTTAALYAAARREPAVDGAVHFADAVDC